MIAIIATLVAILNPSGWLGKGRSSIRSFRVRDVFATGGPERFRENEIGENP